MKHLLQTIVLLGCCLVLGAAENLIEDPSFSRINGKNAYWQVEGSPDFQAADGILSVRHEGVKFFSMHSRTISIPSSAAHLKISVEADALSLCHSRRYCISLNGNYADGSPISGTLSVLNLPQWARGFRKMEKIFTPAKAVKSLQVRVMIEVEGKVRLRNIALTPVNSEVEYDPAEIVCNYPHRLKRAPGTELRVLSYNILAKAFGRQSPAAEARAPEIIEIIRNISPDIGGLQELDPIWYQMLSGRIEPWKFARSPYDGNMCAVIYDSRRFRQLDGGVMPYSDQQLRCLRWTLLEEISTGRKLIITNTHWDLTAPKRMHNSQLMARHLAELRKRFPGASVFCTGDFNSGRESDEFKNLLRNTPMSDSVAAARHTENAAVGSWFSPRTGRVRTRSHHIDHILVSPGVEVLQANLLFGQLPLTASDHLPLFADVRCADRSEKVR